MTKKIDLKAMKKVVLALMLFAFLQSVSAQDFEIVSVESLAADMSAREEMKTDHNDRQCALLRIATQYIVPEQRERFVFKADWGSELVERASRNGEIWLWVSPGLKHLRIQHPDFGQYELRLIDYVSRVEALHTYKMIIKGTLVITTQVEENSLPKQQYLVFQLNPKDAVLEVNDQLWPVSAEGTARKFVNFGTYSYCVQSPNYYPETGIVTVNDPNNKKNVIVNLNPNFGWVEVKGTDLQDASVYIDNAFVGKASCKSKALKSGKHEVRIVKEMYKPYSDSVVVRDNETLTLSPSLTAEFSRITLMVDADAEIWVNEEKKGFRSWTGNLAFGSYPIECRQAGHEPSLTVKEITDSMSGQTITLSAPKPIYGSLNMESSPDLAKIYLDGKVIGETPYFIPEILIGQHEIRMVKEGYYDYVDTVIVVKDERKQVEAVLREKDKTDYDYQRPNRITKENTIPERIDTKRQVRIRKSNSTKTPSIASDLFWGSKEKHENLGGFHFGSGIVLTQIDSETYGEFRGDLYYANLKKFPFYLNFDLIVNLDEEYYFGVGAGSVMTLTDKLAINYGVGYRWFIEDSSSFNVNAGITYMFDNKGWGGFSYAFEYPFNKGSYYPLHKLTYIFGETPSVIVVGGVTLLGLIAVAAAIY